MLTACACLGPMNGEPLCPCQMRAGGDTGPQFAMTPELREMLDKARDHVMTPKETYEQKISWIQGLSGKLSDPMPTREAVVARLAAMGIVDPEPSSCGDKSR